MKKLGKFFKVIQLANDGSWKPNSSLSVFNHYEYSTIKYIFQWEIIMQPHHLGRLTWKSVLKKALDIWETKTMNFTKAETMKVLLTTDFYVQCVGNME